MRIEKISIKNFRSIKKEIILSDRNLTNVSLIGKNNSGKSNILRAINMFFNEETDPGVEFNPDKDGYLENGTPIKPQINLIIQFEKEDKKIVQEINKNYKQDFPDHKVSITLLCHKTKSFEYKFTTKSGKKKNYSDLIGYIKNYVECTYIPSIKDVNKIINEEMLKKIVGRSFSGWAKGLSASKNIGKQKENFSTTMSSIESLLNDSGKTVSEIITEVVPTIEDFTFTLPYEDLEEFLGTVHFKIKESHIDEKMDLNSEGSGIQSFTILTMLKLLHEIQPKTSYINSKFIWLIEEPETFMHHDLQRKTKEKIEEYSSEGNIFFSTHSPVFIDKENFKNSYHVNLTSGSTSINEVGNDNVLEIIGGSLGVDLSDFLDIKRFNFIVEGTSDKELIESLNKIFKDKGMDCFEEDQIKIHVGESANGVQHALQKYGIFSNYADFFAVFDRDSSGLKARDNLLKSGYSHDSLLLIPKSPFKTIDEDIEIEDLVDKSVWDKILKKLEKKDLLSTVSRKGELRDYKPVNGRRSKAKEKFCKELINEAKNDISNFARYEDLVRMIRDKTQA